MKILRPFVSILMTLLIIALAAGTVVEKFHGSDFAIEHVYSSWWFITLWALFAIAGAVVTFRDKNWKNPVALTLFLAVVCILFGALLTMLTGQHGRMKLEPNKPIGHFFINEGQDDVTKETLPFSLTLDRFEIVTYEGSDRPKDYVSYIQLQEGEERQDVVISMNHILRHRHYRFYQSDYDNQGSSILEVARDPWGIAVTYAGYALLFIALLVVLFEQRKTVKAVTWSWLAVLVVLLVLLYVRMRTHQLLPVLRSPFFSIHISTIVTAYALLLAIMVVGIIALFCVKNPTRLESLKAISTAMLYPAVALLAAGIFIGAIWANVSWGNYWSWDPKEVWALVTLLIYAMPLFPDVFPLFRKPLFFHIYTILAILSVVITYFGVNLILGGVHAYQ